MNHIRYEHGFDSIIWGKGNKIAMQSILDKLKNYNQIDCEIVIDQIIGGRIDVPKEVTNAVHFMMLSYQFEVLLHAEDLKDILNDQ